MCLVANKNNPDILSHCTGGKFSWEKYISIWYIQTVGWITEMRPQAWNTGLDYWTELPSFLDKFLCFFRKKSTFLKLIQAAYYHG